MATAKITDEHDVIEIKDKVVKIGAHAGRVTKGDSYSDIYTFKIARYVEGVDVSDKTIAFLYVPVGEEKPRVDYASSKTISDDAVTFTWILPPELAIEKGDVPVTIQFIGMDEDEKPYVLSLSLFLVNVGDALSMEDAENPEGDENWFSRIETRMSYLENYTFLDEKLKEKMDKYVADNKIVDEDSYAGLFSVLFESDDTRVRKTELDELLDEYVDNSKVVVKASTLHAVLNHKPPVEALDQYFDALRTDKVYITKLPKFDVNQTSDGIKVGINEGLRYEPSTDTVEGVDDYAELPEFRWMHGNYVRDDNGNAIVTATQYDNNFQTTGTYDVGSIGMSFYYKWDDESDPEYTIVSYSTSPHEELGLVPFSGNVEGHSYWCLSAYPASIASDGLLRSQPNAIIENFISYNKMMTLFQKKGKGYWGAGSERNVLQLIMLAIKGATKNSQNIFAGLTSNNWQYEAAVIRSTEATYFPVTASQANNIKVGDIVQVGHEYIDTTTGQVAKDRGNSAMYKYAKNVKVTRIDDMEDGNKAVYLDIENGFATEMVTLSDTAVGKVYMSSLANVTGETDKVIGMHDGSCTSNTDGKHAYRIQGVEYGVGYYIIPSDTVMLFKSDYSKDVYVASKGVTHSSDESTIKSTYKKIGNIPAKEDGSDFWGGDVSVDEETGGFFVSSIGSGSKTGTGDMVYAGGKSTSGLRAFPYGGHLRLGSSAGSASLYCWLGLSGAGWNYCACD